MKKIFIISTVLLLLLFLFSCKENVGNTTANNEEEDTADALITVNGDEITTSEFDKYYAMQSYDFEKEYGKDVWNIEKYGMTMTDIRMEQTIDYLIRISLIKGFVNENGFVTQQKVIDDAYKRYMDSIENESDRLDYYEAHKLDEKFLKRFLTDQLYLKIYQEQILAGIKEDEDVLKELFEDRFIRYKSRHILVKHDDLDVLKDLKVQIDEGVDFSDLARDYSIHSTSAVKGGDLGYITIGNMPKEYEKVALEIELYTTSDIIETEYGYHLIFIDDRQTLKDLEEYGMPEGEIQGYKDEVVNKFASLEIIRIFDTMKNNGTIEINRELLNGE